MILGLVRQSVANQTGNLAFYGFVALWICELELGTPTYFFSDYTVL